MLARRFAATACIGAALVACAKLLGVEDVEYAATDGGGDVSPDGVPADSPADAPSLDASEVGALGLRANRLALGGGATDGGGHTCVIGDDAAVYCWGDNTYGQLGVASGDGGVPMSVVPLRVDLPPAVAIAARMYHTCAIVHDPSGCDAGTKLYCWGLPRYGAFGDPVLSEPSLPRAIGAPIGAAGDMCGVLGVAVGNSFTCVVLQDRLVYCTGYDTVGQDGRPGGTQQNRYYPVPSVTGASAIAASSDFACAVAAGALICWGDVSAVLRDAGAEATTAAPPGPADLDDAAAPISVTLGTAHTCVLDDAAAAYCGAGTAGISSGQLCGHPIDGKAHRIEAPLAAVAAGYSFTCFVESGGGVQCCGANAAGQLGNGRFSPSEPLPQPVVGLAAAAVGGGYVHACAVTLDGGVSCWGSNAYGQLGNPDVDGASNVPVPVRLP
jgi:alpha-tubulin suppressor-like RCC1 family protein